MVQVLMRQVSDSGDRIVFTSESTDLIAGDNNGVADIFLFDTNTAQLIRINLNFLGLEATGVGLIRLKLVEMAKRWYFDP